MEELKVFVIVGYDFDGNLTIAVSRQQNGEAALARSGLKRATVTEVPEGQMWMTRID